MKGHDTMIMGVMKTHIKGKRTKRPRPSPTLTLTLASTSSSTTSENSAPANHNGFFQMPATTSIDFTNILQDDVNTDQDIAYCLMLLAHGHHNKALPPQSHVYECKTCDRGFTSFQALGGHRAGHNKPPKGVHEPCGPSNSIVKGYKVHECSICGSVFTSGQALGGHMRRHRSMTMSTTATTCNTSNEHRESKKHKIILPLDLNLPAPMEDDLIKEADNSFGPNNQIILFSAPALVDCHF
ncbi:hypothetical protein QVD17_11670 [Tagetes erecta]|uniref:C2H2-type domain-containing protein n=1 Tax=Tagetes erecta TaxID=13708 RepID=A0AAD8KYE3_TARER|nr:hypothetical protein QVD17_11670 [Tagetes erecta]